MLLAAAVIAIGANASAAEDAPGIWLSGALTGTLGEDDSRWLYSAEAHARYFDLGSGINQWLLRPAIGYAISKDLRASVGYSRYRIRSRAGDVADENRYWQELEWKAGSIGDGNLSVRGRLEQRDISVSGDMRHAARLRVKYALPLTDAAAESLVLSAESYFDLNTTDWGGDTGLAQYRLYGGFTWRLGSRTTLDAGYMYQHFIVESAIDRANHLGIFAFKMVL